jgi:hypothetical protein
MKTIIIRLPAVEAAMLLEVQQANTKYRDLKQLIIMQIRDEYGKLLGRGKS